MKARTAPPPIGLLALTVIVLAVSACTPRIPAASEFTVQAVGTLMPGGHEEAVKADLAADQSGVLFVNQTGYNIQVAVNGSIATLPIGQDFLFVLPAGQHTFYIYEPDSAPRAHAETLAAGKLRYLYISHVSTP